MASKLVTALFVVSALVLVINIGVFVTPSVISYTLKFSLPDYMNFFTKPRAMDLSPGMPDPGPPAMDLSPGMPAPGPPAMDLPPGMDIGDIEVQVCVGIWQYSVQSGDVTEKGSYFELGDKVEHYMSAGLAAGGINENMFRGNVAVTVADLVRTYMARIEIWATFGIMFSIAGVMITFANMFRSGRPLLLAVTLVAHVGQAILIGVVLSAFAQGLDQTTRFMDIFTFVQVSGGYTMLAAGFIGVLMSTGLAIAHLVLLAGVQNRVMFDSKVVHYKNLSEESDHPLAIA